VSVALHVHCLRTKLLSWSWSTLVKDHSSMLFLAVSSTNFLIRLKLTHVVCSPVVVPVPHHYHRYHSCWRSFPECVVLSHIKCLSQCEVVGFQVILYSLEPCDNENFLVVFSGGSTIRIFSASMLLSICAVCPKRSTYSTNVCPADVQKCRLMNCEKNEPASCSCK